jgi:hypothetical protein
MSLHPRIRNAPEGSATVPVEIVMRLQNVVEGSDVVAVDLAKLFPKLSLADWRETTLALDDDGERRLWGGGARVEALVCRENCSSEVNEFVAMTFVMMMTLVMVVGCNRDNYDGDFFTYFILLHQQGTAWTARHKDIFTSI